MKSPSAMTVAAMGEREIVITRAFDAPRALVFDAWTKPELLTRWLGVRAGWRLAICEIDLRVGGAYRFVWRHDARGIDMGVGGVYREITPPARLAWTETFDQSWYPGESLVTIKLVEHSGQTSVTMTLQYESREARDIVLASPMEQGLAEGYDTLAGLLAELRAHGAAEEAGTR